MISQLRSIGLVVLPSFFDFIFLALGRQAVALVEPAPQINLFAARATEWQCLRFLRFE